MNYWITNNAKFRPFSYDEMIKPVEKMYTEHKGIEEGLAELQTKAGIWEGLANEQTDPVTYAQYKRYADELRMAADDLAMNGLNARSRQNLYNMKARYASEITPIEQAYQLRAADIKAQSEAAAKSGGRTVFSKSARTASLDDYRNGMPLDYTSVNLDSVYNTVASGTQAITKRYFNTKEGSAFKNEYFKLIQQQGLNPTEAFEALKHSGKYPELDKYYNDALQSFGISNFSEADQARIMTAADMGMNAGIYYDQKEQLKENPWTEYARKVSLENLRHKHANDEIDRQKATPTNKGLPGSTIQVHLPTENTSASMKLGMAGITVGTVLDLASRTRNEKNAKAVDQAKAQLKQWMSKYRVDPKKPEDRRKLLGYVARDGYLGGKNELGYAIRNGIRKNVTKNENLINIWTDTRQEEKPAGTIGSNRPARMTKVKVWGDFDNIANQAFTVNAVQLKEDQAAVSAWLDSWFNGPLSSAGKGKVHLYDVSSSTGNGRQITLGKTPKKVSDLPKTSDGSIDTSGMHRTNLPSGDYLITWRDSKGNLQQGVLPAEALGEEEKQRKIDIQNAYKALGDRTQFPEDRYTEDDIEVLKTSVFNSALEGAYLAPQIVKVEPFKIGG